MLEAQKGQVVILWVIVRELRRFRSRLGFKEISSVFKFWMMR
jgi:hypothetical protein